MGAFEDLVRMRLEDDWAKRALCPKDGLQWIEQDGRLWCPFCGAYREDTP